MKKMKKFASLLLALALSASLAVPAMAADTHTITVNKAVAGETYTAYKLFDVAADDVTKGDDNAYGTVYTGGNFVYTITKGSDAWNTLKAAGMTETTAGGLNGYGIKFVPSTTTNVYNVVPATDGGTVTEDNATALAAALNAIKDTDKFTLDSANLDSTGTATGGTKNTGDATATISVATNGYYFVDSSLGALCGLNTATPDVTINEKNAPTTITKKVAEGEETMDKAADAMIGETVNYEVVVNVQSSVESDYTVIDTMDAGLTLDIDSIEVDGNGTGSADTFAISATNEGGTSATDKGTYTIVLKAAYLAGKDSVTITYSATVNEYASIEKNPNDNTVTLKYANQTVTDYSKVYTFGFNLLKYTGAKQELNGAGFTLYAGEKTATSEALTFVKVADNEYRYDSEGAVTEIPAGHAHIYGLDAGTYTLEETTVPAGYNGIEPMTVTIAATYNDDGTLKGSTFQVNGENKAAAGAYDIEVENNYGAVMPSTGGIGTTIFYVVGGMLVVCAGVVLVSKKRMGAN